MSKETVIWLTIAVYVVFIAAVGIISRRSSRSMTDFTVGDATPGPGCPPCLMAPRIFPL